MQTPLRSGMPYRYGAIVLLLLIAGMSVPVRAGDTGRFIGSVLVEWLEDPFVQRMKLAADFGFVDENGKTWTAHQGQKLDGGAFPPVARAIVGLPYAGDYRRAFVVYESYTRANSEPWPAVHRMLFNASRVEGLDEIEAKILYTVAYASGSRWEIKESSRCFGSCHAAAPALSWRPAVADTELRDWVEWTRRVNPSLDRIDEYLNGVIKRPGPHLFMQR
jgi:Protein of unknown function (DUF1353)